MQGCGEVWQVRILPALQKERMMEYTKEEILQSKKDIDHMSQEAMASLWRYAPAGHPYFDKTLPLWEYFNDKFKGFTPEISKAI